ncbi:3-hydroxyanthranilate 3,4-dioxygenase [Lysinibacillus sp. 3P01SB]|uniref:3-hydroxyanthranilate 3,4-dioxygenase n=1 Tax=Lysinibacillus sp. 3P01SB TaxID=3132284 RepID=UPI0039A56E6F
MSNSIEISKMQARSQNIWKIIEDNKDLLKPPVNNKALWEDSQFLVMLVGGPNARREFHVSPSDEIFYQVKGSCYVEIINDENKREVIEVKEGEMFVLPGNVPHSPHRVADTYGIVIEYKRKAGELEDLVWLCDQCDHELHRATLQVTNIGQQIAEGIAHFNATEELRTCNKCGHVMPETVEEWK